MNEIDYKERASHLLSLLLKQKSNLDFLSKDIDRLQEYLDKFRDMDKSYYEEPTVLKFDCELLSHFFTSFFMSIRYFKDIEDSMTSVFDDFLNNVHMGNLSEITDRIESKKNESSEELK